MLPAGAPAGSEISIASPVAPDAASGLADGRWPAEEAVPGEAPGALRDTVR